MTEISYLSTWSGEQTVQTSFKAFMFRLLKMLSGGRRDRVKELDKTNVFSFLSYNYRPFDHILI
jgi:hypothetical protein